VLNGSETCIELALGYNFIIECPEKLHENSAPWMFENFYNSFGKRLGFHSEQ
jgi:hypothetical protein